MSAAFSLSFDWVRIHPPSPFLTQPMHLSGMELPFVKLISGDFDSSQHDETAVRMYVLFSKLLLRLAEDASISDFPASARYRSSDQIVEVCECFNCFNEPMIYIIPERTLVSNAWFATSLSDAGLDICSTVRLITVDCFPFECHLFDPHSSDVLEDLFQKILEVLRRRFPYRITDLTAFLATNFGLEQMYVNATKINEMSHMLIFSHNFSYGSLKWYLFTPEFSGTLTGGILHPFPDDTQLADLNNLGQVIGQRQGKGFLFDPKSNSFTDLGTLPGEMESTPSKINDQGHVIGQSGDRGFLYINGTMFDLGNLPGEAKCKPLGINSAGDVVGFSGRRCFLFKDGCISEVETQCLNYFVEHLEIDDEGWIYILTSHDTHVISPGSLRVDSPVGLNERIEDMLWNSEADGKEFRAWSFGEVESPDFCINVELQGFPVASGLLLGWCNLSGPNDWLKGRLLNQDLFFKNNIYEGIIFDWRAGTLYLIDMLLSNPGGWHVTSTVSMNSRKQVICWAERNGDHEDSRLCLLEPN